MISYFVAQVLVTWDRVTVQSPPLYEGPVKVDHSKLPGIGYLEVFDSLDALHAEYPDAPWFEVETQGSDR